MAANNHALQKRDGSWCLLSKTETQVPGPWQPKPNPITKDSSKENGVQSQAGLKTGLKDGLTEGLKDAFKGSATVLTSALDACTKGAIKLWESWRSTLTNEPDLTNEPEEKTQATPAPKLEDTRKIIIPNSRSNQAQIEAQTTNYGNSGDGACTEVSRSGNSGNSRCSWTAIQMNDPNKTIHCLRCSPEGRLLFKRQLLEKTFTIHARNVDCTIPPEPSVAEIEEALSLTHVEIAPGNYAVVDLLNGCPQLPERIARKYDLHRRPDGSWFTRHKSEKQNQDENKNENETETEKENTTQNSVLRCQLKEPSADAKTEGPVLHSKPKELPTVVKKAEVNGKAKSTENHGNSSDFGNYGNSSNGEVGPSPASRSGNAKLLSDLEKTISNHLVCTAAQRTVLALWVLHTYACSNVFLTPYLNIYSPVEESGKTTCLAVLRALCAQPWWAGGTSPAAFKRKLAAEATTVLLDNWQTLFRASDKHPMTGFLLNGCDFVPDLCAHLERREKHKVEVCHFSPKAFAGSESLPPALARRSIPIVLQRRRPAEKVIPLPYLMLSPKTKKLTSAMQAWAKDHQAEVTLAHAKCSTQLMLSLSPHQQESASVLLAIAAVIGGDWPVKAHDALKEIFDDYNEGQSSATQLLSDIRDAFAKHGNPERLFTNELLPCLHELDHRTYDQWNKKGDPMTAHALARFLDKHFKIHPSTLRRKKERVGGKEGGKEEGKEQRLKGYQRADFEEAWERYLPPLEAAGDTPEESTDPEHVTTAQEHVTLPTKPHRRPTRVSPNNNAACHDVTLQKSTPKTTVKPGASKWPKTPAKSFSRLKDIVSRAFASAFHF